MPAKPGPICPDDGVLFGSGPPESISGPRSGSSGCEGVAQDPNSHDSGNIHAWAAGLFDGEGYICIRPKGHVVLQIDICHEATVKRLGSLGGRTTSYSRPHSTYRKIWRWRTRNIEEAQAFLEKWLPNMTTKLAQATIALNYIKNRSKLPKIRPGERRTPKGQRLLSDAMEALQEQRRRERL